MHKQEGRWHPSKQLSINNMILKKVSNNVSIATSVNGGIIHYKKLEMAEEFVHQKILDKGKKRGIITISLAQHILQRTVLGWVTGDDCKEVVSLVKISTDWNNWDQSRKRTGPHFVGQIVFVHQVFLIQEAPLQRLKQ